MNNTVTLKKLTPADAETLLLLSRKTFFDAFYHLNHPDDMEAYAQKAFTVEKLQNELNDTNSEFYFVMLQNETAGYLKLNYHAAQTEFQDPEAIEIERIYVLSHYQGKNIGSQLLNFVLNKAKEHQLKYIWLGVWDQNHGAIRFYQRHGFEVFSSHEFMLGSDKQTDLLLKKVL